MSGDATLVRDGTDAPIAGEGAAPAGAAVPGGAAPDAAAGTRVLVFSSLFPSAAAPTAGTFIKERMFRVARTLPIVVVAPQPWSPLDALIRRFRPSFRPRAARRETIDGIDVHRPTYLSVPGVLKRLDGWLMAAGAMRTCRRLQAAFRPTVIDAHFLYPDGFAATVVGRRLGLPVVVSVRGSKDAWLIGTSREPYLRRALQRADRVVAVSEALRRDVAVALGRPAADVEVIGNGVDTDTFRPVDRGEARARLGLAADAPVIVGVGGLTDNKGFHRVIESMPRLRARVPGLTYLVVGGGTSKGDERAALERLAARLGVADAVRFCGPQGHDVLRWYYGAADAFVLATAYEGWANVFLEAMACGLPVVTTDVGGNRQVVCDPSLGTLVPFWDAAAFEDAVAGALSRDWDRPAIRRHAQANGWDRCAAAVVATLRAAGTSR